MRPSRTAEQVDRRGMYFGEFHVGQSMLTAGRTVTEMDIVDFAAMTGDWNPLHTDAEFARQSMFGERIAHGVLGVALASGLVARLGVLDGTAIAAHGIKDWQFLRPIRIGDTVRVRIEVESLQPVPHLRGGKVTLRLALLNQRGEELQRGLVSVGVLDGPEDG